MIMVMMNCFYDTVDLQRAEDRISGRTIVRKPQHCDFPTRRDGNRTRIAEMAILGLAITSNLHSIF